MPIRIQYRFNYYHEKDVVEFILSMNNQIVTTSINITIPQTVSIILPYNDFLVLMGEVVRIAQPFFEQIAQGRASGIKQDLQANFDEAKWNKMMEGKNESALP